MKSLLKKPVPLVFLVASLFSQGVLAQATSGTHGQDHSMHGAQPAVDHAAMEHGTVPSSQSAPPASAAPAKRKAAKKSQPVHSGTKRAQSPPAAAPNNQHQGHHGADEAKGQAAGQNGAPDQHQGHGGAHAGHAMPAPQEPAPTSASGGVPPAMDHSAMGHGTGGATSPAAGHAGMTHPMPAVAGAVGHDMQMGPMQGGSPPPNARDPNAYNEGTRFAHLGNHEMNDDAPFWKVLVDRAEAAKGDGERGQNLELEAWYGNDYNKAWVKVEGERRGGTLHSARAELLWDRAFATFWSTQLGVRHDSGEGKSRDWLAFGVQGLAPYWFETEATAYWRGGSGLAVRLNAKYEVLFTSRLILEPEVEANLYSRSDPERATGSGLSDLNVGLRLRYEITRQVAPYIGVTWNRQFGKTADFTRMRGGDTKVVQAVAGVRFWF